jgi:hypothetical protein
MPVYGSFPSDMRARPESLFARAERKRGISVPSLPCPSLVIYGDEFPRGARLNSGESLRLRGIRRSGPRPLGARPRPARPRRDHPIPRRGPARGSETRKRPRGTRVLRVETFADSRHRPGKRCRLSANTRQSVQGFLRLTLG